MVEVPHNRLRKNVRATGSVLQLSSPVLMIPGISTIGCFFFSPYRCLASSPVKKSRESRAFLAPSRRVTLLRRSRGSRLEGMVDHMSARSPLCGESGGVF